MKFRHVAVESLPQTRRTSWGVFETECDVPHRILRRISTRTIRASPADEFPKLAERRTDFFALIGRLWHQRPFVTFALYASDPDVYNEKAER